MNKSELIYRRITYSLFIILFLIVTPLIIFYTQGYRFNFKNQHIQQTGILVISSNPKKADITLVPFFGDMHLRCLLYTSPSPRD